MTRKNCETNWGELAVAALFEDPTVETIEDIRNCRLARVNPDYANDLDGRKPKMVKEYLATLREQLANFDFGTVDRVVLLGKNQTADPEIAEMQKGLDRKKTKADVMVKFVDGRWIGISVKALANATHTNYSIEKILPTGKELKQIRLQVYKDAGCPVDKYDKSYRDQYNACLYVENDYFNAVERDIEKYSEEVRTAWVTGMWPDDMPFDLYLFNGVTFTQINKKVDIADVKITRTGNPHKKSKKDRAAKMFYDVEIGGENTHRWEIRCKGNLYSAQICTHPPVH